MDKQTIRFFLLMMVVMLGFWLFEAWQQAHSPALPEPSSSLDAVSDTAKLAKNQEEIPSAPVLQTQAGSSMQVQQTELPDSEQVDPARIVKVTTDLFELQIDKKGGDIIRAELLTYPKQQGDGGAVLLSDKPEERSYVAQSGLLNEVGPDSQSLGRAVYQTKASTYQLAEGKNTLVVDLIHTTANGVKITKRFSFERDNFVINHSYQIENHSNQIYKASMYGRLKRQQAAKSSGFMGAMRTYTGAAVNTPDKPYKKLPFEDMKKSPFRQSVDGGWLAMVEHYFLSAWIPDQSSKNYYQSEVLQDDFFGVRYVGAPVEVYPGERKEVSSQLYLGPEIASHLKALAPGLELTIDYGIFWPICQPIFWLLKTLFSVVGNWGIAIILTTLVIKLMFYKLSAASYRSMGNMRKLQPKIEALKARYGEDKQKFGQAVMGLYKQEKINPLGGCLPILIQIPVFIALYYVLLESVELRLAPFGLWIQDLASKDPFYVLPLLMGASMFVQQRLSPAPPDPMQAKIMMFMPVVFTVLFLQFPSGLVLYWLVNNVLSILQQWHITRKIEAGHAAPSRQKAVT